MKSLNKIKTASLIGATTTTVWLLSPLALAASPIQNEIEGGINSAAGNTGATANAGNQVNHTIGSIVNILSTIIAIIAVIMIIVAGFRYVTSGGNTERTTSAKNTIVYAVVGLVIVALAQFIVRFVVGRTSGP